MRRWTTGTNDYYYTAGIFLEEAPWYIFAIEHAIMWICHTLIPRIPLPSFIKITRDGEYYTLRSYYGTIADLFHAKICYAVTTWCWNKTKKYDIDFPYQMLENLIPESIDKDNDMDRDVDELYIMADNKRYSDLIGEEFKEVYNKLKSIGEVRMKK